LLLLGPCVCSWSHPSDITAEQIHLINTQLDNLHELIAMTRTSSFWLVLLFLSGLLVPIVLGLLVLHQADRSAVHHDEVLREMHAHDLTTEVIDVGRAMQRTSSRSADAIRRWLARLRLWRRSHHRHRGKSPDDTNG
jgi:hypothetical protein